MRQVETESSDSDYGDEFVPKTRAQKNQKNAPQQATSVKPEKQAEPKPAQQTVVAPPQTDIFDLIGGTTTTVNKPAIATSAQLQQSTAFDFIGGSSSQ